MQIIEVTGLGVRSSVIRLRRRDTPLEFVFYPMIHMGQSSFYASVTDRLHHAQVIVAEGVGPSARAQPSVLAAALTLSYSVLRFRRRAGLVEQDIDYGSFGVPVINPDVTMDEFRTSWRQAPLTQRLMMWCVLPVVIVGRLLGGTEAIWSKAMEVNDLPSNEDEDLELSAPELVAAFGGERDHRLLAALQELHRERGSEAIEVAVVYGARHVAAAVHGLRDSYGYIARSGDWLTVVDLADAPETLETLEHQEIPAPTPRPRKPEKPRPAPVSEIEAASTRERRAAVAVARLRGLVEQDPEAYRPRLAHALLVLSDRLADRGRADEGLALADEAVDIAEDLRDTFGATYQPLCASAAYALGQRLRGVGRDDDATALYAESVELYRGLYRNDPYKRATSLGPAITDYAGQLLRQDRHEEAVAAAQEAIALYRAGNVEAPDEFNRPWAFAFRNLAMALLALGRTEEALDAARRGVNMSRRLLAAKPDQTRILEDNLIQLAQAYRALDRHDEAAPVEAEAAAIAHG